SATAPIDRPDRGTAVGSCRLSSFSDRVIRRAGTLAAASACAVRSTIRSWNEKSSERRGPRAGDTNPAFTRLWIVLRERLSSRSTSRTPYWCIACGRGLLLRRLFRGRGLCGRAPRGLARLGLLGLRRRRAFLLEARAQRLHQVDHLAPALRRFLGHGDLLALDLLLHRGLDALLHLVLVRGGVEGFGGLLLDQLARELQLGVLDLGLGDLDVADLPHLVGVEQLLHHEAVGLADPGLERGRA